MVEFWNLIQIGSVYLTSTEGSGGDKLIANVGGTDAFAVDEVVGETRALSTVVYQQASDSRPVDVPITIRIPLMPSDLYDAVRDVVQAYIDSPAPFTFALTGQPENFTGTAKPAWNPKPLEYSGEFIGTKIRDVVIRLYVTLS